MVFCPKCGTGNNDDAEFCKNCGSNVKNPQQAEFSNYVNGKINLFGTNNFLGRINSKINLFGVYIGLAVSLLVLIIAPIFYGIFVSSGAIGIMGLLYLVVLSMMLVGGFVTSILSCRTYSEGMANGGFLGLVSLINLGFVIGAVWFYAMAMVSQLSSVFGGYSSTGSSSLSSTSTSNSSIVPIAEIILLAFLMIVFGIIGGWIGIFVKKLVKNNI